MIYSAYCAIIAYVCVRFQFIYLVLEKYEFWMWVFVVVYKLSFKCENMEIVLGGSWMVIPTMSVIWLFAEVFVYCEGVHWCLHVKYIVYKHFNT